MYYGVDDVDAEVVLRPPPATSIEVFNPPRSLFEVIQAIQQLDEDDSRIDGQLWQCSECFDEIEGLLNDLSGTTTTVEKVLHLVENLRLLVGFYHTFIKDAEALKSTKQKWLELADEDDMGPFGNEIAAQLKWFAGRSFRCTTQHPAFKLWPRWGQQAKNLTRFLNRAQHTWLYEEKRNLGLLEFISSPTGSPMPGNEQPVAQGMSDGSADDVLLARGGNLAESVATKVQQFLSIFNEDDDLAVETNEIFDDAGAPRDINYLDTRIVDLIKALKGLIGDDKEGDTNGGKRDDSSDISSTMEEIEEEIAQREKMMGENESGKLQDDSSGETDAGPADNHAMANDGIEQESVGNELADVSTAVASPVAAEPPPEKIPDDYYRDLLSGSLVKIQAPRKRETIRARIARERAEQEGKEKAKRKRAAAQAPSSPVQETMPRLVVPDDVVPAVVVPAWQRVLSFFGLLSVVPAVERVGRVFRRQPKRAREAEQGESEEGGRQKRRRLE